MNRETLVSLFTNADLICHQLEFSGQFWDSLGSSGTLTWGPCAALVMSDVGKALPCTGLFLDVPTCDTSTALTANLQSCSGA